VFGGFAQRAGEGQVNAEVSQAERLARIVLLFRRRGRRRQLARGLQRLLVYDGRRARDKLAGLMDGWRRGRIARDPQTGDDDEDQQ
jgi:hypothetical protein